jgi:oligoendopeptidase F
MESSPQPRYEDLPRWDMTAVAPHPASPEFAESTSSVTRAIDDLTTLFAAHGIGLSDATPASDETVRVLEQVIAAYNATFEALRLLENILLCLVSADTHDAAARAASESLGRQKARLAPLEARFATWVGSLDLDDLLARSPVAREHEFALRQAHQAAEYRLAPD